MKEKFAARGDLSEYAEISAGVSHAEGQLQRRHLTDTNNDDLTGVTTTPRGKRREKCEVQNKAEEAAARAAAEAGADSQLTAARAAATLARVAATLAKTASDREVARKIVRHRRERLKLKQQSLAGNITER